MSSAVEICSNALRMLGANPIINLTDQSVEARLCNGLYASTRDELIVLHPWNFCKKRVGLAQLLATPVYGQTVQYELPSDCLGPIEVFPSYPYKIEGRNLLAHSSGINLLYKARIEDVNLFPAYFISALTASMTAKLAYPITRQIRLSDQKYNDFGMLLSIAKVLNDHEDTPDVFEPNILTRIRLGGG